MAALASDHGVPVFQPERINSPEGVAGLKSLTPDLLVVAAYGQILSQEVLAVPAQGGINVHASLLPKYRGAAPVAWAIYHGETRTGVSIIRMSVHLDAGDVLAQESVTVGTEETAGELEARLADVGASLALETVMRITTGSPVPGVKQDKSLATKAPKLTKEHGRIDWNRTAVEVCNHVRAMQPWPTAYTFLHRQGHRAARVIINRAVVGLPQESPMSAGSIFEDSESLRVAAGDGGVVEVRELQPAGKRRMAAAEFLRGHPIRPGDLFGAETP
jgi:methionyl-tRNA formyltransferase